MSGPKHVVPGANVDDQWQLNCTTVSESIGHYFMNEDDADVWFEPLLNAANPPKKFPCHSFVLKCRSPVFYAQFRFEQMKMESDKKMKGDAEKVSKGQDENKDQIVDLSPAQNKIETVKLPDIEPEAFEEFLRFCYTDKAQMDEKNATSIFYIANRYTLKPLMLETAKFIKEHLSVENACDVFKFSIQFNHEEMIYELGKKALGIIRTRTEEVLKTESFLETSPEHLLVIMRQDDLAIKEIGLFKALIRWGKKKQKDAENSGKSLRELITPALSYIQFRQMSIWTFGRFVVPTKVLSCEESLYIFEKLSKKTDFFGSRYPFSVIPNFRGGQYLTYQIENVREFTEGESKSIPLSGFLFAIYAEIKHHSTNEDNDQQKMLGMYLFCKAVQPDSRKKWSCEAAVKLYLVSKTTQKIAYMLFTHRFEGIGNKWDYCGESSFMSIEDLAAKGYMEGDSVSLHAKVQVLERSDFDEAKNEVEIDDNEEDSSEE